MMSKDEKLQDLARRIWQGEFAKKHIELLKKEEAERKEREYEKKEREYEKKEREYQKKEREYQKKEQELQRKEQEYEQRLQAAVAEAEAQAHTLAVHALTAAGIPNDAIAEKLKLSHERVVEILKSND